jgi:hypothetical protein
MALRAGVAKLVGVALAGSLLIFAAPAAAKPCHPHGSGNSEVDQYMENVPGPCGNQGIGGNGSGNQGTSSGPSSGSGPSATGLPTGTISQLESSGPAGEQAASFAQQTNPSGSAGANGGSNGSASSGSADTGSSTSGDGGGGSFLSALGHMVTGNQASAGDSGQGLGPLLPTLLAVALLGGVGVLALRRRRTG